MLAFLATSVWEAQRDIKKNYHVDRGEVLFAGRTMPFQIITRVEQVRGLRLFDAIVLPHAEFDISPAIVREARMRIKR